MDVISRADARAAGLIRFFTGVPCIREHIAERYTKTGSCLECCRTAYAVMTKLYKQAHPEKEREWQRIKYERNKHKYKDGYARYRDENRDKIRSWNRNRKALQKQAIGRFTASDIRRIFDDQRGKCAYCRKSIKSGYDIDHIVAITNGGSNDPRNIQLLCSKCNGRKRAKDPTVFAREIGLLI